MEIVKGLTSTDSGARFRAVSSVICMFIFFILFILLTIALFTMPKFWGIENPNLITQKTKLSQQSMIVPGIMMCAGPIDGVGINGTINAVCEFNNQPITVQSMTIQITDSSGYAHPVNCLYANMSSINPLPTANLTDPTSHVKCGMNVNSWWPYAYVMVDNEPLYANFLQNNFFSFGELAAGNRYGGAVSVTYLDSKRYVGGPFYSATWTKVSASEGWQMEAIYRFAMLGSQSFVEFDPLNGFVYVATLGGFASFQYVCFLFLLTLAGALCGVRTGTSSAASSYENL